MSSLNASCQGTINSKNHFRSICCCSLPANRQTITVAEHSSKSSVRRRDQQAPNQVGSLRPYFSRMNLQNRATVSDSSRTMSVFLPLCVSVSIRTLPSGVRRGLPMERTITRSYGGSPIGRAVNRRSCIDVVSARCSLSLLAMAESRTRTVGASSPTMGTSHSRTSTKSFSMKGCRQPSVLTCTTPHFSGSGMRSHCRNRGAQQAKSRCSEPCPR
jgi:hypothetical protein